MTPIERVSARGRALSILGLASTVSMEDVRAAYGNIARQRHPDLASDAAFDFAEINAAYDYLSKNGKELGIPERTHPTHPSVRRPSVSATECDLTDADISECQTALEEYDCASSHVPVSIRRRGRNLTYIVKSRPNSGTNLIAVPTGALVDSRRVLPQLVTVKDTDIENGAYDVPANLCEELFPGAKAVKIKFSEVA